MPRKGRPVLTILLILIALVVVVVLVLPLLIPKDQVRGWIVRRAEQELQRPVAVGAVRAGLLPSPWVRLTDLDLGEGASGPPSRLTAEAVTVRLSFWPILQRRAEVTSLVIERPRFEMALADPGADQARGAGSPGAPRAGEQETDRQAQGSNATSGSAPGGSAEDRDTSGSAPEAGTPSPTAEAASPLEVDIRELEIRDGSVSIRYPDGRAFVELGGISEQLSAQVSREAVIALRGETVVESLLVHLPSGTLGRGLALHLRKRFSFDTNADHLLVEEATLELGDLPASVTGEVRGLSSGQLEADLQLAGGPASVENILGYLPAAMLSGAEGVRSSGTLSLSGRVHGPLGSVSASDSRPDGATLAADFEVDLELIDGRIEHPQLPDPIDEISVHLRASPEVIEVRNFTAHSGESRIQARATVSDCTSEPALTAGVDADVDLETVTRLQSLQSAQPARRPAGDAAGPPPLQLGGRASAQLVLEGSLQDAQSMDVAGSVRLRGIDAEGGELPVPVRDMNAQLSVSGSDLTIHDLAANVGSSDIRASGGLANYRALDPRAWQADAASAAKTDPRSDLPVARIDLTVHAGRLNIDELMLPMDTEGGSALRGGPVSEGGPAPDDDVPVPPPGAILALLEGTIAADVEELIVNRTTARDIKARLHLDRGRIRIESATGLAFGGQIAGDGEIDFRKPDAPRFDMQMQVLQVQAAELYGYAAGLSRFGQLGGYLTGEMDATAKMQGTLTEDLALELGSFSSDGLLQTHAASLSGHPLQEALAGYLDAQEIQRLEISDWLQPFRIANGRVTVDGMNLKAGEIELSASGSQGIDGSVEFGLELLLPQSLSAGIRRQVPSELRPILFEDSGAGGRVLLPLTVTGRLPKPKFALDERRLREGAQQRVEERLARERERLQDEALRRAGDFLEGLADRSSEGEREGDSTSVADSTAEQPDPRNQLQRELEDRLKGLFKKGR